MKQAIIIAIAILLGFTILGVAEAKSNLFTGKKVAQIDSIPSKVEIYEVKVSTSTTCYVSMVGQYGSHTMSCVR